MNYDEMPAGYDIDRLVAEKVMGWRTEETSATGDGDCRVLQVYPNGKWRGSSFVPSRYIAHAWEVVEKMPPTRGPRADSFAIMRTGEGWTAGYHDGESFDNDCASADTAPLAICRAALKAVQ